MWGEVGSGLVDPEGREGWEGQRPKGMSSVSLGQQRHEV